MFFIQKITFFYILLLLILFFPYKIFFIIIVKYYISNKMSQQNFDEEQISQNVLSRPIPHIQTSRHHTAINTQRYPDMNSQFLKLQDLNRREGSRQKSGKNTNRIRQNLAKQKEYKENKMLIKKQQVNAKQLQSCTFKPKINEGGRQRTLQQFLQSQTRFMSKVNSKKQNLKITLEQQKKEQTFKPKTNNKSINNTSIRKQPIHQRLYKLRTKQSNPSTPTVGNSIFMPQIAQRSKKLVRQLPVSDHLYNDALRRQQQFKDSKQLRDNKSDKLNNLNNQSIIQKPLNILNEKYVAQKFIKQFYLILQDMHLIQDLDEMDSRQQNLNIGTITFDTYLNILIRLGFIPSIQKIKENQKNLAEQSYKLLQNFKVSIRNICVFAMAVLGIYHINPINFQNDQQNKAEQEQFNLDQNQGRKLQKKYDHFFRNRLYVQQQKKTPVSSHQIYAFKPQINPKSEHLAQNYRSKMLSQTNNLIQKNQLNIDMPKDGLINHIDLLNLNKLAKQVQVNKRREQQKKDLMKQCTFKPNLYDAGKRQMSVNMSSNIHDFQFVKKYDQLYNLSKNNIRTVKNSLDIQYQKNSKQCTFAPKINKKKNNKVCQQKTLGKDAQKVMARMAQARRQKQQKNKILGINNLDDSTYQKPSKKHTQASSFANMRTQSMNSCVQVQQQQQQLPYLVIDVNLGDQNEQISIYKNRIQQPQKVAQQFAQKHGLDTQSKDKLADLLKCQINNIMRNIQEQGGYKMQLDQQ